MEIFYISNSTSLNHFGPNLKEPFGLHFTVLLVLNSMQIATKAHFSYFLQKAYKETSFAYFLHISLFFFYFQVIFIPFLNISKFYRRNFLESMKKRKQWSKMATQEKSVGHFDPNWDSFWPTLKRLVFSLHQS